jgi:hypothetical protein
MPNLPLIACSLSVDRQHARLAEWQELLATATSRAEIDGGARYVFAPAGETVEKRLRRLAQAEQECCSFFDFVLERTPQGVVLSVTAPVEAQEAIRFLFR